jgi:hypothetical protein
MPRLSADFGDIRLEVRSAEGKATLLPERAAELVRLRVDVIVTSLTPTAQAAKQATRDIPIVMARRARAALSSAPRRCLMAASTARQNFRSIFSSRSRLHSPTCASRSLAGLPRK